MEERRMGMEKMEEERKKGGKKEGKENSDTNLQ